MKIIIRWASTNDKSIPLDREKIYVLSLFGNFPGHLEHGQEDSAALFICTEKIENINRGQQCLYSSEVHETVYRGKRRQFMLKHVYLQLLQKSENAPHIW